MRFVLLFFVFIGIFGSAAAKPVEQHDDSELSPGSSYRIAVDISRMECKAAYLRESGLGECLASRRDELKKKYEAALKTVKKPGARAAIKEFHFAAMRALGEIIPEADETNMEYRRRQAAAELRVKDAWTRYQLE